MLSTESTERADGASVCAFGLGERPGVAQVAFDRSDSLEASVENCYLVN